MAATMTRPTTKRRRTVVRFAVEDLLIAAAWRAGRVPCTRGCGQADVEPCVECDTGRSYRWRNLAMDLRVDPSAPSVWRRRGGLSERQADRYATALGLGPELVWPDYLERTVR